MRSDGPTVSVWKAGRRPDVVFVEFVDVSDRGRAQYLPCLSETMRARLDGLADFGRQLDARLRLHVWEAAKEPSPLSRAEEEKVVMETFASVGERVVAARGPSPAAPLAIAPGTPDCPGGPEAAEEAVPQSADASDGGWKPTAASFRRK